MLPWSRKGLNCAWLAISSTIGLSSCAAHDPAQELGRVDARLVGGTRDTTHHGVVALLKQQGQVYDTECTGTLLAPNLVLTAQHCVAPMDSGGEAVVCGVTQFLDPNPTSTLQISVETNVHADGLQPFQVVDVWTPDGSREVCGHDVALVVLADAGVPANLATPIEPALYAPLTRNETFSAIGYGVQNTSDPDAITAGHRTFFGMATVGCIGAACGSAQLVDGELAATSPVCNGDSGGPALDQQGRVSGVASRGDQACQQAVYGMVTGWRDYIVTKALAAAQSGGYTPPSWATDPPPDVAGGGAAGSSSGAPDMAGATSGGALATGGTAGIENDAGATSAAGEPPLALCTDNCPKSEPRETGCSVVRPLGSGTPGAWLGAAMLGIALGLRGQRRRAVGRP